MRARELGRIRVGDRVTFKCVTRWNCGRETNTRVVNEVDYRLGGVRVRYGGWEDFHVRPKEIIGIEKRRKK